MHVRGDRAITPHREVLEPEVPLLSEVMRRYNLAHNHDVLDTDAELAVFVVSRLCNVAPSASPLDGSKKSCVPFETVMPGFKGVLL